MASPEWKSSRACESSAAESRSILEIRIEDGHGEVEGAVSILVVEEQHADEFLTDVNFGRVGPGPTDHADRVVREASGAGSARL